MCSRWIRCTFPAPPPTPSFQAMDVWCETDDSMPPKVKRKILEFLHSFEFDAFKERYIKAHMFDKRLRPFILRTEPLPRVPGIARLKRDVKATFASKRAEKKAITKSGCESA